MHSSKNKEKEPTTTADAPNSTTRKITNALKGLLLFVVSAVAVGFFYIASQAIAAATAGKTHDTHTNARWWFNVDGIELLFYLAALSAVLHFVVNAGGGPKIKHWYTFVIAILTISAVLVGVAPGVYRQVQSDTETVEFDRGGCQSVEKVNKKFDFSAFCPLVPSNGFIRYDFNNRTEEEIKLIAGGIDVLSSLAPSQTLVDVIKNEANTKQYESFLRERCVYIMIDALCAETFREVSRVPRSYSRLFFFSLLSSDLFVFF